MKVNLKNVCYPKPLLSGLVDDYKNNTFIINMLKSDYDKDTQKLTLEIESIIENEFIKERIDNGEVAVILHLEQKTQRELVKLNPNSKTSKEID